MKTFKELKSEADKKSYSVVASMCYLVRVGHKKLSKKVDGEIDIQLHDGDFTHSVRQFDKKAVERLSSAEETRVFSNYALVNFRCGHMIVVNLLRESIAHKEAQDFEFICKRYDIPWRSKNDN
jgi:hypothetical protein